MGIANAERELSEEINQNDLIPTPTFSGFFELQIINDDGWFNYFYLDKETAEDNRDYCLEKGFKTALISPSGDLV